ncbi:hypothetical protein N7492_010670 [Penicillium capsulatum]|uniref:Dicer-like protein 1 n=1 Tax=Penicillium capsulatum TaxID=69766 RepID=A0A9W9LFP5_9EURO|nr:hypothetical protein N7492_010670 [Penicillium capsulatum]KAJ6113169.1 hypothetical protein N7512_008493 [Penicillium capsulatum]
MTSPRDYYLPDISDAESHSEDEQTPSLPHLSLTRRVQNAQFEALLSQHALEDSANIEKVGRTHAPDADLSIGSLVAKQDVSAGNLDPRAYQLELFERAKAQNIIAVLDTGSGKTLIAVLLLRHILQAELIDRAKGKAPRTAFFLVASVTLVFQQTAFLRNNLDQEVGSIFGAVGPDLWDQKTWDDQFQKNMVIVCTAEILNQCLLNAFIKMRQINLLIFDEAHHTKKEHPYARIMRESYIKVPPSQRPKIFGMTASPIDANADITEAALQLETLLYCQIATTARPALVRQVVHRPTEETWEYGKLEAPFKTELYHKLRENFGDIKALDPIFRFAWHASSELGRWCADQVWAQALADEVIPKLEGIVGREEKGGLEYTQNVRKDIDRVKEARRIVDASIIKHPRESGQLSSKAEMLISILTHHFGDDKERKCIVFTERRHTAKTLLRLCEELNIPNLRPGVLVGVRKSDLTGTATFRNQFLVMMKFRQGEINCLFATSVAEEGLDIPDCNLVVRFNLFDTLIQYMQSRGRARHANSTYVSMTERGNADHRRRLQDVRRAEMYMENFCHTLPQNRLLLGENHDLDSVFHKGDGKRVYTIPSTGAKLTYRHAVDILSRYANSLQYRNEVLAEVNYVFMATDQSFSCEVLLPEKSPIRGVIGGLAAKKAIAKQSAAFDTCLLLRKNNLLDDHFRSVYHKRLPAMRNAKLAIISKKTNQYSMLCKPSFWAKQLGGLPVALYGMVIEFRPSEPLARNHEKLVLLARGQLPTFPSFPLFLEHDIETTIQTVSLDTSFSVTSEELSHLSNFTVSVFHDIFHKTFNTEPEKFPYWLAPAKPTVQIPSSTTSLKEVIDWDTLLFVRENRGLKWSTGMSAESLLNKFLYDEWDGRKRYFPLAVDNDLKASDPPPSYVPRRKWMENILNYTLSLSKNSRPKFLDNSDWTQPVYEAQCICLRRNFLDRTTAAERSENTRSVICPQPLTISPIPVATVTSCLAFPAIISRIESYLIVMEGCQSLGLNIDTVHALEAFTKDSDNTDDHRSLQIHVQRGMGKNYERLEFLGDSFLKMATSISLFCQRPDDDEYDYHVQRMCLICNKNMFNTAVGLELYQYIRSRGFSRHAWYPPGLQLLHRRNYVRHLATEGTHALGEKTIADVCEALIGASLLTQGKENRFDMAIQAVTIFVKSENHSAKCWADYRSSYTKPGYQIKLADGAEIDLANKIFERLNYRFKYPRLLRSAFTHPSYPSAWAKVPCYQRLEFLGDALLDMACIEYLFHRFPDKDPQWLTEHKIKMAMVSNKFLGALAVKLGFHRHLQHFSAPIQSSMTHYAEDLQTALEASEGAMDYWLGSKDSPKATYIAAIFVDSDFDYSVVEDFFVTHVKPFFVDMSLYDTFASRHPTTHLHTQMTSVYYCTNYCLKAGELPVADGEKPSVLAAVMIHGKPVAKAVASSGRYAKIKASERALEALDSLLPTDFRLKFGCDCQPSDAEDSKMDIGTAA